MNYGIYKETYNTGIGGSTYVGSVLAKGGYSGHGYGDISTPNGGSAGGRGYWYTDGGDTWQRGDGGASDGNDSNYWSDYYGFSGVYAYGQGTTTRAFGESDGTLYAGGGGGGNHGVFIFAGDQPCQNAGSGGGGRGGSFDGVGEPGHYGTGGGAGGSGQEVYTSTPDSSYQPATSAGGSGIAIIRWGY